MALYFLIGRIGLFGDRIGNRRLHRLGVFRLDSCVPLYAVNNLSVSVFVFAKHFYFKNHAALRGKSSALSRLYLDRTMRLVSCKVTSITCGSV